MAKGWQMIMVLVIGFSLFGCQKPKKAPEKPHTKPSAIETLPQDTRHTPCRSWVELTKVSWIDLEGSQKERWLKENESSSPILLFETVYLEKYRSETLPKLHWPVLAVKYVACKKDTLQISHEAAKPTPFGLTESLAEFAHFLSVDLSPSDKIQELSLPLPASLFGLRSLAKPQDFVRTLSVNLESAPPTQARDYPLKIEPTHLPIPAHVTFSFFPSPSDAKAKRHEVIDLSSNTAAHSNQIIFGEIKDMALGKGIGNIEIAVPQQDFSYEVACQVSAKGDLFYTLPFQSIESKRHGDFSRYDFVLSIATLGELSLLATAKTDFQIRCRIGDSKEVTITLNINLLLS